MVEQDANPIPAARRGLGELVVLGGLVGSIGTTCLAMGMGLFAGDIGVAATMLFIGIVGGLAVAVSASLSHARLGPAESQALGRHPGWYRYGPVGGLGGVIALVGLLYTVIIRAPSLFLPILAVVIPAGAATAVLIRRTHGRPPHTFSIKRNGQ